MQISHLLLSIDVDLSLLIKFRSLQPSVTVFALLQFVFHSLQTAFCVALAVGTYSRNWAVVGFVQDNYVVISDIFSFSAPISLFITR